MKDITISNYRCYDHKTMEFRKGINLLIGDNSSGKTSLVRACNFVANSLFCGYSDENTNWKSMEDADIPSNEGVDEDLHRRLDTIMNLDSEDLYAEFCFVFQNVIQDLLSQNG